jgi:hypothetical protein
MRERSQILEIETGYKAMQVNFVVPLTRQRSGFINSRFEKIGRLSNAFYQPEQGYIDASEQPKETHPADQ